jgi:D-alanyl-D-alanine carboxypeptidase
MFGKGNFLNLVRAGVNWIRTHSGDFLWLTKQRFANVWVGPLYDLSAASRVFALTLISIICIFGNASCHANTGYEDDHLPELAYSQDLQEAIDLVLLAYPEYDLGISAAAIVPGYRTWTGVSGYSQKDIPITTDMLFIVGSVQKNFEAALALKLAEEGVLSLDDPVSKYLPTIPNLDGRITIRQLLNHTSGVFNVFENPDFPWVGTDVDYSREWSVEEVFRAFVLDPYGPPGYAQHYSSTNYLLVTKIIEEATGSTVPDEVKYYFLEPMKLDNTFISMGEQPPAKYSVAHPWVDVDLDGNLDDLHGIPRTWSASLTHPVMFSTPEDLVRWIHAIYHEGTVISPDSLAEMLTYPEVTLRDPEGGVYGLGVVDYSDRLDTQVYGHFGSSLGYSASALYLPEYNTSVAWLINTGESPHTLAGYMMFDTWSALTDVFEMNRNINP